MQIIEERRKNETLVDAFKGQAQITFNLKLSCPYKNLLALLPSWMFLPWAQSLIGKLRTRSIESRFTDDLTATGTSNSRVSGRFISTGKMPCLDPRSHQILEAG